MAGGTSGRSAERRVQAERVHAVIAIVAEEELVLFGEGPRR